MLSIFFAVFGGFIAYNIGIPLPWLLGPLFLIGFFFALKVEIKIPKKPLPFVRALLGFVIGANFIYIPETKAKWFLKYGNRNDIAVELEV